MPSSPAFFRITRLAVVAAGIGAACLSTPAAAAENATPPATASATANDCRITDLMPDFWTFWRQAQETPRERWPSLFRALVRERHAAVYDVVFKNLPMSEDELVGTSFGRIEPHVGTLGALSAALSHSLPQRIDRFRRDFPAFRCEVPVIFLYSAGAFDGAIRTVGEQRTLMFGLDVVARLHGEEGEPLYVHELFHLYHGQQATPPGEAEERLFWSLWREGLATWVACGPNPSRASWTACGLPAVAEETGRAPELARLVAAAVDSTSQEDYARFFLGGRESAAVPARSGYWIGYLVVQRAAKDQSVVALARLGPEAVRPLIVEALAEIGK